MSAVAKFTQADVKRAVMGVQAAGIKIGRVRIDPRGGIEIDAATPGTSRKSGSWDDVLPTP